MSSFPAIATAETGAGAVFFGLSAAYDFDHAGANFRDAWSGTEHENFMNQGLEHIGVSKKVAHQIDMGIGYGVAAPTQLKKGWDIGKALVNGEETLGSLVAKSWFFRKNVEKIITNKLPKKNFWHKNISDLPEVLQESLKAEISSKELQITHGLTKRRNKLAKLVNDIKLNGIEDTIKFVEHDGVKYVVDGHYMLYAALKLGFEYVPVEKVELPYAGYKSIDDLYYYGSFLSH